VKTRPIRLCLGGVVEYSEYPGMLQWSSVQAIKAMAPVTVRIASKD
jgi:hypothetical protein